jgi:hypothetical protein
VLTWNCEAELASYIPGMRSLVCFAFALVLATAASAQQSSHVFILMLENRSDSEALQYMPYLSGLANQYGQALQAYSPSHGSFNAYLEIVAGSAPRNGESDNGNCNGIAASSPTTKTISFASLR